MDAKVPSYSPRVCLCWVGLPHHHATCLYHIVSLPHHDNHRARRHVAKHFREEGLLLEVLVVLRQQVLWSLQHLQTHQFEAPLFKALDYLAHQTALYSIWLHCN
uniref:Uncharacterized protein n=1 Tax=Anguilla anguilla TaxID=7936 RepID=A0A0E9XWR8_ANGAN